MYMSLANTLPTLVFWDAKAPHCTFGLGPELYGPTIAP